MGAAEVFPVSRCMNLSNHLEVGRDGNWRYGYRPDHITQIADAGFDTLRVPARVSDYFEDGAIDPAFAAELRDVIETARAEGLFVILDLHHFEELMNDPDGQAGRFVAVWAALSETFADIKEGLAFELLNEPVGALTTERALPLYASALAEIRARQADRWVIYGGANWNAVSELAGLPRTGDPRVVHTFHYYIPDAFTHQGATWRENAPPSPAYWGNEVDLAQLDDAFETAAAHHAPTFLGEFGVIQNAPAEDRETWLRAVRQAAEARGIPWCHWGFGAGFGAFDPETGLWDPAILDAFFD
ncbi:MAG: glycoside hydrolase family 5 protein [Pseudomonadota bacterium]